MLLKNKIRVLVKGAVFLSFFLFQDSLASAFDFSDWDGLLKKHVKPATIDGVKLNAVNYKELKADPGFQKVLDGLKTASLGDLKTKEEKLAFWINTYNVLAAKVVVDNYPVESIKDVGSVFKSVWKRLAGTVAGEVRTLNDVEHEILRKMGEPRIHVAIVCASVSCPDIRMEAYKADELNEQLDDQMRLFLANREKGLQINEKKKRVYLSSIFKWFAEDFEAQGGVVPFISKYVSVSEKKSLQEFGGKIKYLDYNWDLNDL